MPLPFQAIVWPLLGGGLNLVLNRLLPGWIRRLLATAAALASLAVLWSLKAGAVERVEVSWEPLNLFRMGLTLSPDGLSLLIGITLAGATAAMVLGIRGHEPEKTGWHGVILLVLAGCLVATMAANLIALAVGSALIDVALILLVLRSSSRTEFAEGLSLGLVIPGVASTLLLFFGALHMDAQLGHGSLLSRNLSEERSVLIGVAALRSFIFPFHVRRPRLPETVAALLLPIGVGGYLLARVGAALPVLSGPSWLMPIAVIGLLAGGVLAWCGGARSRALSGERFSPDRWWTGLLVYQAGYVFAFVLLLSGETPWPIVGMSLALTVLVIWWDTTLDSPAPASHSLERFRAWLRPWWKRIQSRATALLRIPDWRRDLKLGQFADALLPVIALASLAGLPFTLGARGRWPYYAAWLKRGDGSLLLVLIAETLLVAGLWVALSYIWALKNEHRPRPAARLAMLILTASMVLVGLAPGLLTDGLDLKAVETAGVSRWGLGLLYLLPWLLGAWLGRLKAWQPGVLDRIGDAIDLGWFYRGAGWVGQRLVNAVHWLSQVGEGASWWGWALIILALGVVLFTVR